MTMVKAPPKQTPIASRTTPGEAAASEPPMVKISTMAAPTYMPARAERTRWLTSERRCASSLATACPARVCTASVYM